MGYYESVQALLEEIKDSLSRVVRNPDSKQTGGVPVISDIFLNKDKESWFCNSEEVGKLVLEVMAQLSFNTKTNSIAINPSEKTSEQNTHTIFHFSEDIHSLLGRRVPLVLIPFSMRKKQVSRFSARVHRDDSIYLHCDQINNSIVSNFEAPIMRCIPFTNQKLPYGDVSFHEFLNPIFTDFNTQSVYLLSFELRNNQGNLIKFASGSRPVRLTLKIRPKIIY